MAMHGLRALKRSDDFGVYPLRGKLLNVRDCSKASLQANEELQGLMKALGLHYCKSYATPKEMRELRYSRIIILTDADSDGLHITGFLLNFLERLFCPCTIEGSSRASERLY